MFLNLSPSTAGALWLDTHCAIIHGLIQAWVRAGKQGNTPHEPDFVAGLVLDGMPYLQKALQKRGVQASVLAVYCHQRPKVRYAGIKAIGTAKRGSCELGDVLFVHIDRSRGQVTRNALLFQAKTDDQIPTRVDASDEHQLHLYTNWPTFSYTTKGLRRSRTVLPPAPHRGAQYLLIDKRDPSDPATGLMVHPGTFPAACCMAAKDLRFHSDLGSEIVDMLRGLSGRSFGAQLPQPQRKGWDGMVWDLLESAIGKAFRRKRIGVLSGQRASDPARLDGVCQLLMVNNYVAPATISLMNSLAYNPEELASDDRPPDEPALKEFLDFDDPAVSVVLIETTQEG